MTTIAWDGRTLASDSMTTGTFVMHNHVKILNVNGDLIGFAGGVQCGEAFFNWYKSGCPTEKPDLEDDFEGVVIRKGKCYFLAKTLVMVEVKTKKYALGAGAQFAMAALHCGKTAVEAVKVAIRLNHESGGKVVSLTLNKC